MLFLYAIELDNYPKTTTNYTVAQADITITINTYTTVYLDSIPNSDTMPNTYCLKYRAPNVDSFTAVPIFSASHFHALRLTDCSK